MSNQLLSGVTTVNERDWSYEKKAGFLDPSNWALKYPNAIGMHQSPIDIDNKLTIYKDNLNEMPLKIYYDGLNLNNCQLMNKTFQISSEKSTNSDITGGPVRDSYQFLQFHMHWSKSKRGSEHSIDGKHFAAEFHFVNWNRDKFVNADQAGTSNNHDGLLVFAILIEEGEKNNEFDKIINMVSGIALEDDMNNLLKWRKLFPKDRLSYYTYDGSLTYPPCSQCVKWIVFKERIQVSKEQLELLRLRWSFYDSRIECSMECNNCRPTCPLNDRIVYRSYE